AGNARIAFNNGDTRPPLIARGGSVCVRGRSGRRAGDWSVGCQGLRARWSERQCAVEGRPLVGTVRFGPDASPVRLNGRSRHGEAQATALNALILFGHAIETIKNMLKVFGRDTPSLIAHTQA